MKKNIYLSIITLLVLAMNGCSEDFLETNSTNREDEEALFANTRTALLAVNGLHKLMWIGNAQTTLQDAGSNSAFYGGYDMLMIWFDMLGEDLVFTYHGAQFYLQAAWTGHRNITAGSQAHFYRLLQYYIANANIILDRVNDAMPGTPSEKSNLRGQAHFYRAFACYNMVQMYAQRYKEDGNNTQSGLVIRNDNSLEPRARATVEEVYAQINSDADEAIKLLAATNEKRPNKSHIDVHVARGLKARVLLTQGKWREAAEMAKLVVEQSEAKLQDDTYTTTVNRFSDNSNKEWLWGSNATLTPYVNLTHFHGYMSNEMVSYNQASPRAINSLLYNRISETDVRKGVWFPRGGVKTETPRPVVPPHTNSKYANYHANKFLVTNAATNGNRHIPFMRLPEMMLIMAEGYARAGQYANAQDALYPLAVHRDPQYVKSANTGDNLINEVMVQRRVELWGEGFRFFDLKRLNERMYYGPAPRPEYNQGKWTDAGLNAWPDNEDPEASNFWRYSPVPNSEQPREIPAGDIRWQWYIPQSEIDINPLCEQNP